MDPALNDAPSMAESSNDPVKNDADTVLHHALNDAPSMAESSNDPAKNDADTVLHQESTSASTPQDVKESVGDDAPGDDALDKDGNIERPLQIITTGTDADSFHIVENNLALIVSKIPSHTKVAIVSVVGAFRSGKSFLLNFFLRYLRYNKNRIIKKDRGNKLVIDDDDVFSEEWMTDEGELLCEGNKNENNSNSKTVSSFAWRGGEERETTGIWMWSEPFCRVIEDADGKQEKIAIILMDTQGMFDNETSMTLTAQIFGLSTFVSSFQIFNVNRQLSEDSLQHLALFSEYGRLAVGKGVIIPEGEKSEEEKNESEKRDSNSSDLVIDDLDANEATTDNSTGVENTPDPSTEKPKDVIIKLENKPFQRVQFLVRDWQNFSVEPETASSSSSKSAVYEKLCAEMKTYFTNVFKEKIILDLQSTREQIYRCFESIDAFLLPHPGNAITKRNYNGGISKIEPFFRFMLNRYVRHVLEESIAPKLMNNRTITGIELQNYFEEYVKMFQQGNKKFPKAMTMLEATAEANNRNSHYLAMDLYKTSMRELVKENDNTYVKDKELNGHHSAAHKKANGLFDEMATIGSTHSIATYRTRLNDEITEEFKRFTTLNSLRNPFKDVEIYAIPVAVGASTWFVATLFDIVCTSEVCEAVESAFKNVYMFVAFMVVLYAFWNPFKDISMYTMPLVVAVGAWFIATFINVTCTTTTCEKASDAFERVYYFIVLSLVVLIYKNFRGTFSFITDAVQQGMKAGLKEKKD
jgi:atlastin